MQGVVKALLDNGDFQCRGYGVDRWMEVGMYI